MTRKRWIMLAGIVLIALALAFPFQEAVYNLVILPLAYYGWVFGILYKSLPQSILWIVSIFLISLILLRSMSAIDLRFPSKKPKFGSQKGQVEVLAESLDKVGKGTYYKWQIASRLGRLARDFLTLRGESRTKIRSSLKDRGWHPTDEVDAYLGVGLNGSFAQFPRHRNPFAKSKPTPLDVDVDDVLAFLETQIQKG